MRAIGYVRVSTEEQARGGVSLAEQRHAVGAYCVGLGLELVAVVEDAGVSARTLRRPGLERALALLERGEAEALVCTKLDRLSRSVRDVYELVERFTRRGLSLVSVSERLDTGSASGRCFLGILSVLSQMERELVGERTAAGLAEVRRQGGRLGAPGLGWRRGEERDDAGRLAVVEIPEERATVARLRQLRSEGLTLRAVAAAMEAEARPTKRGGRWHASTVAAALRASTVAAGAAVPPLEVAVY